MITFLFIILRDVADEKEGGKSERKEDVDPNAILCNSVKMIREKLKIDEGLLKYLLKKTTFVLASCVFKHQNVSKKRVKVVLNIVYHLFLGPKNNLDILEKDYVYDVYCAEDDYGALSEV